jgi:hypothetical protein
VLQYYLLSFPTINLNTPYKVLNLYKNSYTYLLLLTYIRLIIGEVLLFNYARTFYLTVSIISHFLTLVNVISKIIPHLLLTAIKVGDF